MKDDYNVRHTSGTLMDMYRSTQSSTGKILNSLDFPMQCAEHPPTSFASDVKAWTATLKNSNRSEQYPTASTRFGIVATRGASHKWHIDTDGLGTYIDPITGMKIWFVGRPKAGGDFRIFAARDLFQTGYAMESPNLNLWDVEVVLLTPRARL